MNNTEDIIAALTEKLMRKIEEKIYRTKLRLSTYKLNAEIKTINKILSSEYKKMRNNLIGN